MGPTALTHPSQAAADTASADAALGPDERVPCLSPKAARTITRIPRWKYDAVKRAVLRTAVAAGSRGATVADIITEAPRHLTSQELSSLGSVSWHVNTVKLDLEARGELMRLSGAMPTRLVRTAA